jgi:hypothetical protein
MPFVGTEVNGDAVSTGSNAGSSHFRYVGDANSRCISEERDLVELYAEFSHTDAGGINILFSCLSRELAAAYLNHGEQRTVDIER